MKSCLALPFFETAILANLYAYKPGGIWGAGRDIQREVEGSAAL